ncbi:FAR1 DNA-binding domain [Sesbania bispinosa]|nr:FAR1 DNA-binding domain [Sesbania bispinosa]
MENECVNMSDDNVFGKIDGEEVIGGKGEGEEGVSGKVHGEEDVGGKVDGEDVDGKEEAYDFYSNYAWCHGFAVRKDDVGYIGRGFGKVKVMRQFVCNREGLRNKKHLERVDRKRESKALTRSNCLAKLRVHLDLWFGKWVVISFEESHNHVLTPPQFVHLMSSYRGLTNADKARVNNFYSVGVRTCHIMGFMMGQKGGYEDLGFCKKDLYNYIDNQKRDKIKDGDAYAALCYLQAKADNDLLQFTKFTITSDDFKSLLYGNIAPEQFEGEWKAIIEKYGLSNNRTTSICEGINSFIKRLMEASCCNQEDYVEIMIDLQKLTEKVENRKNSERSQPKTRNVVGDPTMVKTKGAPKKKFTKKIRCSHYCKVGHTIRTCPTLLARDGLCEVDEVSIYGSEEEEDTINGMSMGNQHDVKRSQPIPNPKVKVKENDNEDRKINKKANCHGRISGELKPTYPTYYEVPSVNRAQVDVTMGNGYMPLQNTMENNGLFHGIQRFPMFPQFPPVQMYPSYPHPPNHHQGDHLGYYPQNFMGVLYEMHKQANVGKKDGDIGGA